MDMLTNHFRKIAPVLLACLLAGAATSCMNEDRSGCPTGFRLELKYTYHTGGTDRLASEIKSAGVYVFNHRQVLERIARIEPEDVARGYVVVPVEPGTYSAVAWAGSADNVAAGGFEEVQMINPQTHAYMPFKEGVTTLEAFRMMLRCNTPQPEAKGVMTPEVAAFGDLFHAYKENIEVRQGKSQAVLFDFVKNTNTLKIKISGLQYLPGYAPVSRQASRQTTSESPLEVFVLGRNGRYTAYNQIDEHAPTVRYELPHKLLDGNTMEVDIKTLRLLMAGHAGGEPVTLHVMHKATATPMLPPMDVVKTIMQAKDAAGKPIVSNQQELDMQDEFPIELRIDANLGVSVTICGYTIQQTSHNLQ